jgi:hypothetical protein
MIPHPPPGLEQQQLVLDWVGMMRQQEELHLLLAREKENPQEANLLQ